MFLKQVIVNGFKSFADRTHVDMHRGVTAIVGPNGCGKSNIVDAIRWVLGEQSAKALRGNKMQDVIFDGTEKRKPLQMCEVSLLFTECEEQLGTAFNEVEIRRRVTRDGSSDYYLNGKACRLRDIQQLFMDTGIGRESYSFMAQGQISQIIDTNPAGRRVLFEEAAGITKYKSQRKETLSRLARVDENLQRVSDVIEEIGRRINSVKRQAGKTLRYKRLKHRVTHLDIAWNRYEYGSHVEKIRLMDGEAQGLRGEVTIAQERLAQREAALENRKHSRAELYQLLQESQERVYQLRGAKEEAQRQAEFSASRSEDLKRRVGDMLNEIGELDKALQELGEQTVTGVAEKEAQIRTMGSSEELYRARNAEMEEVQKQLNQNERNLSDEKQRLLIIESSIARLRNNCTHLEVELKTSENRRSSLRDAVQEHSHNRALRNEELEQVKSRIARKQKDMADAQASEREFRQLCDEHRLRFRGKQTEIADCDRNLAKLTAQLGLLEGLQAKFEGFSDGAKAILQGRLEDILKRGSYRPLTQFLEVENEYTQRLEALLDSATDAIALDVCGSVAQVSNWLQENKAGRAALHVSIPAQDPTAGDTFPEWLMPASRVVRAKTPAMQPHVDNLLRGSFFCNTLENFVAFLGQNPNFPFFLVVTEKFELVDARGIVFGGYRKKQGRETSLIQRESEINRLKKETVAENNRLTDLHEQATGIQQELTAAEERVEIARRDVGEIGREISSHQAEERGVTQNLRQVEEALGKTQRELEQLISTNEQAQAKLVKAGEELQIAEAKIEGHKQKINELEREQEQFRTERDNRREALNDVRLERAEKQKSLEIITRGLHTLEQQKGDIRERLVRRRQENDEMHVQIESLKAQQTNQTYRAGEIQQTLDVTVQQLGVHGNRLKELESEITDLELGLGDQRNNLRKREVRLNELDVALAKEHSQVSFLTEKIQGEYDIQLAEIDWKQQLWKADEQFETKVKLEDLDEGEDIETPRVKHTRGEPSAEELQAMDTTDWKPIAEEVKQLKSRIAAMGEINPAAIEEYIELKERYDFLKSQSDDLWKSKNELLNAIDEINATSHKLFEETFEQVRKNFAFCYKKLNGGVADLKLVDAEDLLESGIEIVAQPVGTKLKTLTLLSGGQKTMTAVALLFAIYMVKPSPFCVLDELDAPLDDANIGRFIDMLASFLEYSQFLVITHNKRTLHVASTIYGVTMQEPGVTKLVSMRFSKEGEPVMDGKAP